VLRSGCVCAGRITCGRARYHVGTIAIGIAFVLTFVVLRDAPESMRRRIGRVFCCLVPVSLPLPPAKRRVEWINEMSLAHYSRKDSVDIGLALELGVRLAL